MALTFTALNAPIGAVVDGFDPATGLSPAEVGELVTALSEHAVLVFRDLSIDAAQLVSFGRSFGELEILPEPDKRDPEHPEIFNLSNVRPDDQVVEFDEPQAVFLRGTQRWHTDSSFREIPCLCTMLYAVEVPSSGGATQFADMCSAYESLSPAEQAELGELQLMHDYVYSRDNNPGEMSEMDEAEKAKYPPVSHPLVRTHGDGRRSLYLGGHVSHVAGRDIDAGRSFHAELVERVTDARFVYEHHWRPGDLVVWDNRTTLHRLRPYDIANERRVMRRLTVSGTEPVR